MTECIDWGRLGYHGHPVPGNPQAVEEGASFYRRTATLLDEGADALSIMIGSTDEIVSEAIDAMATQVGTTRTVMSDLHTRYHATSAALAEYAPALRETRTRAEAAAHEALAARQAYDRHAEQYRGYVRQMMTLDSDVRNHYVDLANSEAAAAGTAKSNLAAARARIDAACHDRDRAAETAAQKISAAIDASTLNDTFTDHLSAHWEGAKLLLEPYWSGIWAIGEWVWEHLDEIALVLDVLSIVFMFVPLVGWVGVALRALSCACKIFRRLKLLKRGIELSQDIRRGDGRAIAVGLMGFAASALLSGLISAKAAPLLKRVPLPKGAAKIPRPSLVERSIEAANTNKGTLGRAVPIPQVRLPVNLSPSTAYRAVKVSERTANYGIGKLTSWGQDSVRSQTGRVTTCDQ